MVEFEVTSAEAGMRIDRLLAGRYPMLSRDQWQKMLQQNEVFVNDVAVRPSRRLLPGQRIRFTVTHKEEPDVNRDISLLYQDDSILVVAKPANLPVHPSGTYQRNTLKTLLEERLGVADLHLVHRLDRETSGITLLAFAGETAGALQQQFLSGTVRKEYLVVVEGRFPERLDGCGWIGPFPDSEVRKMRLFRPDEKATPSATPPDDWWHHASLRAKQRLSGEREIRYARTHFRLLRYEPKQQISLLRARLFTGRTHQIRASLHSLGFPVVGDRLYGRDPEQYLRLIHDQERVEDFEWLRIGRTALHAGTLAFHHPVSGERLTFRLPLSSDISSLFHTN